MQTKHNANLTSVAKMLRKNMTKEEKKLWYDFLRHYPVRFYRQKVLGKYVADFYCAKAKLVVELDGSQHRSEAGRAADDERSRFLEKYDLKVLRISNLQIIRDFVGVCTYIDHAVQQALSQ